MAKNPRDLYLDKLKDWLTKGNRYGLSFPQGYTATAGALKDPKSEPLEAYKELTSRLRDPTPENVSLEAIMSTIDLSLLDPART